MLKGSLMVLRGWWARCGSIGCWSMGWVMLCSSSSLPGWHIGSYLFLVLETVTRSRHGGDAQRGHCHIHVFPKKKNLNHGWKQRAHHLSSAGVGSGRGSCAFCQLPEKRNVWRRRIRVGKITRYILRVKIEDIFLPNVAVITGNSSLQMGNIPITRTWSIAISSACSTKSHFVLKFIYLWDLPHLDGQ